MPEPSSAVARSWWRNAFGHRSWRVVGNPGGKVAAGETERAALARELAEELGLEVADLAVGDRVGDDIALNGTTTLRAYRVHLLGGEPRARDHRALCWVTAAELHDVDWVPADRGWIADLARTLNGSAADVHRRC